VDLTRRWLRLEGAAALVAGVALYGWLGAPWLAIIPLLLVPDVSMVGYLRDPRTGAFTYNLIHNWATGLVVLGVGLVAAVPALSIAGAILIAHVGGDRALGYGLKEVTSFQDTHLGRIGRRQP
jgi:flagellar biosynthesis component FlhA